MADPRILVVVAMEAEAAPVREALRLAELAGEALHPAFPGSIVVGDGVAVATNGVDPDHGIDSIATQPAVVTTLHACELFSPSIVISAGTAGGFSSRGGEIGDVILADRVVYHDRRVPLDGFEPYGVGDYPVLGSTEMADRLGVGIGTVTSGNSLDAPPVDMATMDESRAQAKDMEAAAVAWVCHRVGVRFMAVKAITDLVDHPEDTAEQFVRNLRLATDRLADTIGRLVPMLRSESVG